MPAAVGESRQSLQGAPPPLIAATQASSLTRGAVQRPNYLTLLLFARAMAAPPPIPADHNGLLYLELPPGGTPGADPTVTVTAHIIDDVTEAPWSIVTNDAPAAKHVVMN